ncbi:MAG TPA: UDP-N-acetylmuramoyl-tripeptide--D-alanyl-D-alanine ligase [Terriglobia bacterium]|nr:UDP-N-acetylmuramoyl-tripeptide--D-alanyl-D-alanine ligase [Terriglobia bacterium]
MQMSLEEVAAILGSSAGEGGRVAGGCSIDSRTVQPGELFFAIRGPRLDGHAYVAQALARGAVGAIVEKRSIVSLPPALCSSLIVVADTTAALQKLALAVRRKWGGRLVAITGSAGKTTTKEMTAALLSQRFSVLKSPGNLNNDYGLPLALLQLEPSHQVAVVELAMSAPGEIASLSQIAEPQVGVVTNVAPAHLQFFDSVESIAAAKRELIENLPGDGIAVLNHDDPRVRRFGEGFGGRVVTFGLEPGAVIRGVDLQQNGERGTNFKVEAKGIKTEFKLNLPGRHNVKNALAAIATSSLFDIPLPALQEGLARLQTLHQRSEVLTLAGGITVLNDSYNSNPLALEMMLDTLAAWPTVGRRIVVAGEMLELGPASKELHREAGRRCMKSKVEWLLTVQGDAQFMLEGALEAGLPAHRGRFFSTSEEAGNYCLSLGRKGDVILVKGSRGVHLEKVIRLLQSNRDLISTDGSIELKG